LHVKVYNMDNFIFRLIFFPLWTFHGVVARGRFALPAPSVPHNRHVIFSCFILGSWIFKSIIICEYEVLSFCFMNSGRRAMRLWQHHCLLHLNCFFVYISKAFMVYIPNALWYFYAVENWHVIITFSSLLVFLFVII
jgi:hypothetical protein